MTLVSPKIESGVDATVLIVDDDPAIVELVSEFLALEPDLIVASAHTAEDAIIELQTHSVDVLLADLYLGGTTSGVDVIRMARELHPEVVAILITGHPTVETAISVLKLGASDYFIKPFSLESLRAAVHRGLERIRLSRENMQLREQLAISRIMQAVGSTLELDEILEMVITTAIRELSADAVSILLLNDYNNDLELRGLDGQIADESDTQFLYGRDEISKTVIETGVAKSIEPKQIDMFIDANADTHARVFISHPLRARGQVIGIFNLIRSGRLTEITQGASRSAELIAGQAAVALENAKLYKNLHGAYMDTVSALANAIEIRDTYTRGHTDRVKLTAETIARKLGWGNERLFHLWMGCTLHDIGKIGVPDRILNKPGRLSSEEFQVMRTHPIIGAKIVEGIPFLEPALPYILYHHERWDGKGYPEGLQGKAIPIEGRILAVADTFDAITSDRPYRQGGPIERAISELKDHAGTQFDPDIVDLFLGLLVDHNLSWLLKH